MPRAEPDYRDWPPGPLGYFVVLYLYPPILRRIPGTQGRREPIRLHYLDGRGLLRRILKVATEMDCSVTHIDTKRSRDDGSVRLVMDVEGRGDPVRLADRLASTDGVFDVSAGRRDEIDDTREPEDE